MNLHKNVSTFLLFLSKTKILKLFFAIKMLLLLLCCFSKGENLDFLDDLQKTFYTVNKICEEKLRNDRLNPMIGCKISAANQISYNEQNIKLCSIFIGLSLGPDYSKMILHSFEPFWLDAPKFSTNQRA